MPILADGGCLDFVPAGDAGWAGLFTPLTIGLEVVWIGLEVVWIGLEVVWIGLLGWAAGAGAIWEKNKRWWDFYLLKIAWSTFDSNLIPTLFDNFEIILILMILIYVVVCKLRWVVSFIELFKS